MFLGNHSGRAQPLELLVVAWIDGRLASRGILLSVNYKGVPPHPHQGGVVGVYPEISMLTVQRAIQRRWGTSMCNREFTFCTSSLGADREIPRSSYQDGGNHGRTLGEGYNKALSRSKLVLSRETLCVLQENTDSSSSDLPV
jgi:hypothetical protein